MIETRTARTVFIDGACHEAAGGESIPAIDPSNGETFDAISAGDARDVARAVDAARRAFEGSWGRTSALERGRLLGRLSALIERDAESLASLEARDTGKPISQARADIVATARYFEFYAGAADKLHGETIPFIAGHAVEVLRVPVGVTGHIIPWNYPAQMFGRTLAPSLAVGNATVLKPAEDACLSTLALAKLAHDAGFPPGSLNVVTGYGAAAGAALAAHSHVDLITFTGSTRVGALVQHAAADHHARCILELGGKSPQLVFADADLDAALAAVVRGIVQNAGQTCSAGSRLLVQRPIFDEFVTRVVARFRALRVGESSSDPDVGPLINATQRARVRGFVERATRAGVPLLAETELRDVPEGGFYVAPAVFGPVPPDAELAREEVFGPILAVLPFTEEADAIALANGTDYGLVAGVWTENGARQARLARALCAGQVFVNCYGAGGGIELPFGGFRRSGNGREKGFAALHEFSTLKTVTTKFA